MKKFAMITLLFLTQLQFAAGQIPNNGFEGWVPLGNGMEPAGWYSTNSLDTTGDYFAITRSADHFPSNIGSYSIRLENRPSLFPEAKAFGIALTTRLDGTDRPLFAVSGHPTSLCGYFKFLPQNGDTMDIHFALYKNGTEVTSGKFINTNTFTEWTSFNIQVENPQYEEADSARITLASFYSDSFMVYGNSVLFVDNLSFDIPISGINTPGIITGSSFINPNPASDYFMLNNEAFNNKTMEINLYDISGRKAKPAVFVNQSTKINIRDLSEGIYLVKIKSGSFEVYQKLVIQR